MVYWYEFQSSKMIFPANVSSHQGVSGGGPYALACAAGLPSDKLQSVAIVCGLGAPDMSNKGMSWLNWGGFAFGYVHLPGFVRWWYSRDPATQLHLSDEKRLELFQSHFSKSKPHSKDMEVLKDGKEFRLYTRSSRQAFAQGIDGVVQDGRLLSSDWGFRLEDVRPDLPVQLWYGKLDTNVPVIHGEQTAERLGAEVHLRVEDETHASIVCNWREHILEGLVRNI